MFVTWYSSTRALCWEGPPPLAGRHHTLRLPFPPRPVGEQASSGPRVVGEGWGREEQWQRRSGGSQDTPTLVCRGEMPMQAPWEHAVITRTTLKASDVTCENLH